MKPNAIKTEQEMMENANQLIRTFRNSRRRDVARIEIGRVRRYKYMITNRKESLQQYADRLESFRTSPDFHSASFSGFFFSVKGIDTPDG